MMCAEIQIQTNTNSFTIINGQSQENKIITLHCPKCNHTLFNLGQSVTTLGQAYDFLTANKEAIYREVPYCSQCGTELFYPELVGEIVEKNT